MRTIEIFSLGEHLFEDQAVQKYGSILVMNGIKGLNKVNPIVLWIDAGLSVIEACNSYLNYAKEREITQQIKLENNLLTQELCNQLDILKLQNLQKLEEGKIRIEALNQKLKFISVENCKLVKLIKANLERTKQMLQDVKHERENAANFEKLQMLQIKLDNFIRASLICLIASTDNSEAMVD